MAIAERVERTQRAPTLHRVDVPKGPVTVAFTKVESNAPIFMVTQLLHNSGVDIYLGQASQDRTVRAIAPDMPVGETQVIAGSAEAKEIFDSVMGDPEVVPLVQASQGKVGADLTLPDYWSERRKESVEALGWRNRMRNIVAMTAQIEPKYDGNPVFSRSADYQQAIQTGTPSGMPEYLEGVQAIAEGEMGRIIRAAAVRDKEPVVRAIVALDEMEQVAKEPQNKDRHPVARAVVAYKTVAGF